jgi:GTP cyclohydrolase I
LGSIANKKEKLQTEVTTPRRVTASVKETGMDSVRNYMKTMCNHELLNKNEEIILAREIQVLVLWEKKREELEAELLRYVLLNVLLVFITL